MQAFSLYEMVFIVILTVSFLRALQAACPPGWLAWQDSCYILLPEKMNWFDASKACDRPGVSLVFPNSEKEQTFVWEEMSTRMRELGASSSGDLQLWINCYRHDAEHFICLDYDGDSTFRKWSGTEPSNFHGEDCVRMSGNEGGVWGDLYCHKNYFVACEMRAVEHTFCRSSRRYLHVPQQCLINHQIKSYPVKESIGCGLACWTEPLCRSFNLRKQANNKKICQLNYASRMEVDVTDIKYEGNCYFYEP